MKARFFGSSESWRTSSEDREVGLAKINPLRKEAFVVGIVFGTKLTVLKSTAGITRRRLLDSVFDSGSSVPGRPFARVTVVRQRLLTRSGVTPALWECRRSSGGRGLNRVVASRLATVA